MSVAPWFRCDPSKLIGALSGMAPDCGYVYTMILLRIYEVGGPIDDDDGVLARRTGLTLKRAAEAISWLIQRGKVQRLISGLLDSETTHEELAYREKLLIDASQAGKESAKKRLKVSFKKSKQDQQNSSTPVERALNQCPTEGQRTGNDKDTDIDIEASASIGRASAQPSKRAKPKARLSPDAQPSDADRDAAAAIVLDGPAFRLQWQKFRDHHCAKGSLMADWSAAWRTWLGNIGQFQPRQTINGNGKPSVQDATRALVERGISFGPIPESPYAVHFRNRDRADGAPPRLLSQGGRGRPGNLLSGSGGGALNISGGDSAEGHGPAFGDCEPKPVVADGG
jgi:uncharacterized protein YdaU (DUF1376 family)